MRSFKSCHVVFGAQKFDGESRINIGQEHNVMRQIPSTISVYNNTIHHFPSKKQQAK
jgi:hypothetical protein